MKRIGTCIGLFVIGIFALIGLLATGTFIAANIHLSDVSGTIDKSAALFSILKRQTLSANFGNTQVLGASQVSNTQPAELQKTFLLKLQNYCYLKTISVFAGDNADKIYAAYSKTNSDTLFNYMVNAVEIRMQNNQNFTRAVSKCDNSDQLNQALLMVNTSNAGINVFPWVMDKETWTTLTQALLKDRQQIIQAATAAGIEPRLLVAPLFVEQWREYTTDREKFKSLFKPLQALATSTNFSMGVMNIKQDTAILIEEHLKDPQSPYYLGPQKEHLLDFTTTDPNKERFNRLANYSDHSYSYLYGAIYIAELEQQWKNAGYPIDNRPDIIATLFNIGFSHSNPNPYPNAGGAIITVDGTQYTFGGLAYEFYYSGELLDQFPYNRAN